MADSVKQLSQKIYSDIAQDFASETKNFLDLNIQEEIILVKEILLKLNSWNSNTSGQEKESNLKDAYSKIMEFRTLILGSTSEIMYRIYIRGDIEDINNAQIVTIKEKDLMKIVGRDRSSLRLKQNLDIILAEQNKDSKRQAIFNKHFSNISKGLEHPSRSPKNYVVTQEVIKKYGSGLQDRQGNYLAWGLNNLAYQTPSKKGKSAFTLKLFNRGWIYQAFDMTTEEMIKNGDDFNATTSYEKFHRLYFTKNLDYDNVVGFKGGDVGLMQIKSNMASLMSKTTLVKYLQIILDILTLDGFNDKTSLINFIKDKFTTEDNLTSIIEKTIDTNVERLLQEKLKN